MWLTQNSAIWSYTYGSVPKVEEDFKVLKATAEGDFSITSQSSDGQARHFQYDADAAFILEPCIRHQHEA